MITSDKVHEVVAKHVALWHEEIGGAPLWVVGANPGDAIVIPGIQFGEEDDTVTGMEYVFHAHVIVLREGMAPDNVLATFLHELGRALYRRSHPTDWNPVQAETAAILHSLSVLADEGFEEIAFREADRIKAMVVNEPYQSAVGQMRGEPIWRKFAQLDG